MVLLNFELLVNFQLLAFDESKLAKPDSSQGDGKTDTSESSSASKKED